MSRLPDALVSIGMPVFNGERYLREALASLLAQDYPQFELIISDNGSTDRTEEICRDAAQRDARIRYVRQPENRGPAWNFAFVVRQAQGPYFMWAAHDDLWAATYIRKCLAALQARPEAVLCCSEIDFIDACGNSSPEWERKIYKNIDTVGMTVPDRVHELLGRIGWFAIYGLMRLAAIKQTALERVAYGADVLLLLELLLQGDFVKVPEPLFRYRVVRPDDSENVSPDRPYRSAAGPSTETPYTDLAASLMGIVHGSGLAPSEQHRIFADFIVTLSLWNPYWRRQVECELRPQDAPSSDREFAALLGIVLSRSVPLQKLKDHPLLAALSASQPANTSLLNVAAQLRRQGGTFASLHDETYQEGRRLFGQGRFEEASQLLLSAVKQSPTADRWSDWATARLACNQLAEAELGFSHALQLDRNNLHASLRLGCIFAGSGRDSEAVFHLERSLASLGETERAPVLQLLRQCRERLSPAAGVRPPQ